MNRVALAGPVVCACALIWLAGASAFAQSASNASLCVVMEDGCHVPGARVRAKVVLEAPETAVAGGQFALSFQPQHLTVLDVQPGSACDPDSPFSVTLVDNVDAVMGEVAAAFSINLGGAPATETATLACLTMVVNSSSDSDVCVVADPMPLVVDDEGDSVPVDLSSGCALPPAAGTVSCGTVFVDDTCDCPSGPPDCSTLDSACQAGVCVESPARCEATPINEGVACDDGDSCTSSDVCDEGVCRGTGCTNPSLCLSTASTCQVSGAVTIQVELGAGEPTILGGQLTVRYDPTALRLLGISPGATCDPSSPFTVEISRQVDEDEGRIFYAAGASLTQGGGGTQGPATLACVSFTAIDTVNTQVCLSTEANPAESLLVGIAGQAVNFYNAETCPANLPAPLVTCVDVNAGADCPCVPGSNDCDQFSTDCRQGFCSAATQLCDTVPINNFEPCDDGRACTSGDQCLLGTCRGYNCELPSLCIVDEDCLGAGLPHTLRVELGEGVPVITGGQFSLQWDPSAIQVLDIHPGVSCDSDSPFVAEIFQEINGAAGTAFYAVGVDLDSGSGTTGPATMACVEVVALHRDPGDLCLFRDVNPAITVLVDEAGDAVQIDSFDDCPEGGGGDILSCTEVCTIPTVSVWGMIALALLLLVAAKLRIRHVPREGR